MDDFTAFVGEVVGSEAPRIDEHLPTRSQEPPRMTRKRPSKAAKVSAKGKAALAEVQPKGGASGESELPEVECGGSCVVALPAEDYAIRSAFASIMNRCAAENLAGDIARHETKEVFFEMLDAIFQAAQKNPNLQGPAWAGRLLAEVLLALEKNRPILGENPAFATRYNKLKSYRIPTTPLWPWIERAYQRMDFILDWHEGLHPLSKISSVEKDIPGLHARIQGMGEDEAAREMFDKIIWPILESWESKIIMEPWFEPLSRHAKGDERNPTLPNLRPEFMRVWNVFINRPEGRLSRIERPQ